MQNNRKKILIACDAYQTLLGFRGKLIEDLLVNNQLAVFTPFIKHQDIKDKLNHLGIEVFENNLDGSNVSILSDLAYMLNLKKVIHTFKPDVFFPYTFKPVIYGTIVANYCKVKQVVPMLTGLGYNFLKNNNKNILVSNITKILLRLSLRYSKKIKLILQNHDDLQTLLSAKIISNKSKTFIVNGSGVDLSYYKYAKPKLDAPNYLMIARLINAKGVKEYYEAAKLIKKENPAIIFRLIGPRDQNIDAINQELYHKINSGDVIEYIGEVRDVRPYLKNSSVVVLPSYYGEGVPRCLLEAMAMGRAIITCNSVGCRETVNLTTGKQSGFLIPIKNSEVLSAKMLHFISNPLDILKFGKNARLYAEEKFDVKKVNKHMLNILESN